MRLEDYLQRIGGIPRRSPTREYLGDLLRGHVTSVPFENLDVQLGRRLVTDVEAAYEKIVGQRRGGWCYEQNGLFGWALAQAGFDVTRVAAAVMRHERGDAASANHLCLLVRLAGDGTWLVDVGFGGSLLAPLPLFEHDAEQIPFRVGLRRRPEGYWRFWEDAGNGEFSYEFRVEPADEAELAAKSLELQTDPESSFVRNLVAQRRSATTHTALRGRVLTTIGKNGQQRRLLKSASELVAVLESEFGLAVAGVEKLWTRIALRHQQLFAAEVEFDE